MRILSVLFILSLLLGCKSRNQGNEAIHIDPDNKIESIQTSGLIKSYDIVKLQTADSVLIGTIDKIIVHDSLIYAADYYHSECVFIFDFDGNFKRRVGRKGRGPSEYLQMRSVFVDVYDNTFNILNSYPAKILKYDIDGKGEPREILIENVTLIDMMPLEDIYVGYTTVSSGERDKGSSICLIGRDGKIMDWQIGIPMGWESNSFGDVNVFSEYNGRVYYKPIYEQTLYMLNGKDFIPEFNLDFGRYNWPENIRSAEDYRNNRDKEFVRKIHHYQETNRRWLMNFTHKGQSVVGVYDKDDGSGKVYFLEPNEEPYFISFGSIIGMTRDKIITSVRAESVARILNDEELLADYPDQMKLLREKMGNVTPYDNPVIIIYDISDRI